MKFYQACFGKPDEKWQLFNMAEDMPQNLISAFEGFGNGCTPQTIGTDILVDRNDNPVLLYELLPLENAMCVLRAKYGETDNAGRAKTFVHGFLCDDEACFKDPSVMLTVAEENFFFTPEETAAIPQEIVLTEKLGNAQAAALAGLDKEKQNRLMQCVYAMLTSPTDYPLYLYCDGDLKKEKAVIQCILSALPYPLRHQISFANADTLSYGIYKRIMLVDRKKDGVRFFDLRTGEHNLDEEIRDIEESPAQYPTYYTFAESTQEEFDLYCDQLCAVMKNLEMENVDAYEYINLAHIYLAGTDRILAQDDLGMMRSLLELLARSPRNPYADDFIATVLQNGEERSVVWPDAIVERVEERGEGTASALFKEAYRSIHVHAFLRQDDAAIEEALQKQYSEGEEAFNAFCDMLTPIPAGRAHICAFLKKKIETARTYESVERAYGEARAYIRGTETEDEDDLAAAKEYIKEIRPLACRQIVNILLSLTVERPLCNGNYEAELETACAVIKRSIVTKPQHYDEAVKEVYALVTKRFWERFRPADFEFVQQCADNCRNMMDYDKPNPFHADDNNRSLVQSLIDVFDVAQDFAERRTDVARDVEQAVQAVLGQDIPQRDKQLLYGRMQDYVWMAVRRGREELPVSLWLTLAEMGDEDPVLFLLNKGAPFIYDAERMKDACRGLDRNQVGEFKLKIQAVADNEAQYRVDPEKTKMLKKDIKAIDELLREILLNPTPQTPTGTTENGIPCYTVGSPEDNMDMLPNVEWSDSDASSKGKKGAGLFGIFKKKK